MKRVMYLICNVSHGKGGHFYSLRTTVEALQGSVCKPVIVNIGIRPSPVLEESKVPNYYIHFNGYNFFSVFSQLNKLIKKHTPEVIHSFDTPAHFFGRVFGEKYELPLVLTKCGGKNLKYTPYAKNFILYSKENLDFLKKQNKFTNTNFYLIPNRVKKTISDNKRIESIKMNYLIDTEEIVLLRIARFVAAYEESMLQAINLCIALEASGVPTKLLIIGEVQEKQVYERIKKRSGSLKNIVLITEAKYTLNASELIDISDCVIGTGRGLMEASSLGKILFTPINSANIPILLDEENYQVFLETNFSPRNIFDIEEDHVKNRSIEVLMNENNLKKYHSFSFSLFNTFFNIENVNKQYIKVYDLSNNRLDKKYLDLFLHFLYTIKAWRSSRKKYK